MPLCCLPSRQEMGGNLHVGPYHFALPEGVLRSMSHLAPANFGPFQPNVTSAEFRPSFKKPYPSPSRHDTCVSARHSLASKALLTRLHLMRARGGVTRQLATTAAGLCVHCMSVRTRIIFPLGVMHCMAIAHTYIVSQQPALRSALPTQRGL